MRAKKLSKIWLGPVGQVSRGHVLDVNQKPFERALRDIDALLYVKWNPRKLRGHGCYEIRRRPEKKTVTEVISYQGMSFVRIESKEIDLVNHVLDIAFLNYNALNRIKEMDAWNVSSTQWVKDLEYREKKTQEQSHEKAKKEMRARAREHKSEISDFKEMILSGMNPAQIAQFWGSGTGIDEA